MDTHTFTKSVRSLESLPESLRSRALSVGEKLTQDTDRAELARRLTQVDERTRQAEVEADRQLLAMEQQVTDIEHGITRAERSFREEHQHDREMKKVQKKLDRLPPSSNAS